ncbi:hypothetical protein DFR49_3376 [Hephaestia caeni]|uniref:Uncharacterized protein n=1 Tax=Hephaestia caeni TaxID=645617 RepID=A0A397NVR8_9SPHN|nr:hypothetical protein [Hephaestia caeni]RIA37491.1 hypothetical protein DFR49_3376 [Hephaestia caeni]
MTKFGDWTWYLGMDEDDDEMCACASREAAIAQGLLEYKRGECFWIVEARMLTEDEEAMGAGEIDAAPFAEARGGIWVTVGKDGAAVEGQ